MTCPAPSRVESLTRPGACLARTVRNAMGRGGNAPRWPARRARLARSGYSVRASFQTPPTPSPVVSPGLPSRIQR